MGGALGVEDGCAEGHAQGLAEGRTCQLRSVAEFEFLQQDANAHAKLRQKRLDLARSRILHWVRLCPAVVSRLPA